MAIRAPDGANKGIKTVPTKKRSMELVPPNREKVTGSVIKVVSMELVPPNREKMTGSAQ